MNEKNGTLLSDERLEKIILSFVGMQKSATENEIVEFIDRCNDTLFAAELINMAADGKIQIGWSKERNDFIFKGK